MAKRKTRPDVVGTVSEVADRAAEVAIVVGDRAAELVEQALNTTAHAAKSVGDTVSGQLTPRTRGKTTVGGVIIRAAKTAAQQNRKLVRVENRAAKRATKATAKAAKKASRTATKTAKRATKSVRTAASRATKSVRSTANRAAGKARKTTKRATTKRSKKR
ncbi:MAG TPA: hypothetical protein VN696_16975 [Pyrinomonadaceae bacterium]|nr:hypothetical protein [Pyrinomonadaceae bacterium]